MKEIFIKIKIQTVYDRVSLILIWMSLNLANGQVSYQSDVKYTYNSKNLL